MEENNNQAQESANLTNNTENQSEINESGQPESHIHKKGGIHNNALFAASMGRSATAQVHHHAGSNIAQTGTNIIYEGATAPGGGGSVGSGFTSGQSGIQTSITSESDIDEANTGVHTNKSAQDAENEIDEQR